MHARHVDKIADLQKESPSMKPKSITFIVALGSWTALTLGGSIWGFLVIAGPNSVTRWNIIRSDSVALIAMLTAMLCGGGLWGLGIARLMNANARSMVKVCALTWTGTVFSFLIVVLLLGSYFGGFSKINFFARFFPLSSL